MTYLSRRNDLHGLMVEESYRDDFTMPPLFYVGHWDVHVVGITKKHTMYRAYEEYKGDPRDKIHPNYIIFFGKENFDKRLADFQKMFPDNHYVATITPSLVDAIATFLNPINKNQTTYIYQFSERNMVADSVMLSH